MAKVMCNVASELNTLKPATKMSTKPWLASYMPIKETSG